ncbi:CDP-glycerol glycerophosphotransferase family protein [Geobacillus sp. LEMMJ02]|uniref:CDP-glycerol glycerophosphotransferase family protein n=1 Tax=Geobacillus sp. LEMMJ02 TaxID=2595057 RepID=UPI001184F77D|nr:MULTISPECIES: CDP-glycerol glycerophosphotransferase family protein [Geobacillus]TRY34429.1 CDP-glycerol glycerophosphotransferase family protein [Geobacillus sp. LEMMJ02]WMJ19766.1 CDP-glycerol glycerophosphotransferase family protein [Geobacillus kaustophilus]
MVRELLIFLYLCWFKVHFLFFRLFPLREKITFVVSFGDNSLYVYEALQKKSPKMPVIFLRKKTCPYTFFDTSAKVYEFESVRFWHTLCGIYHLATSKYVIVDNYYGFLAAASFRPEVECIQLWHAAGAFKTFGLRDASVEHRSLRARKRFLQVYRQFHKVVVGSEAMAHLFMQAFQLPEKAILRTGVPRTDFFYDIKKQRSIKEELYRQNPLLKHKRVILYAPTYRDHELERFDLRLDIDRMYEELAPLGFVLLMRLHPAVKNRLDYDQRRYADFLFDYSDYPNVNDLLLVTDWLITDYSSIPFEFCLLNKPMIFYMYDIESYRRKRGLWEGIEEKLPGPILFTTEQIIAYIRYGSVNFDAIRSFAEEWNCYSKGRSSENLVDYLLAGLEIEKEVAASRN